MAFDPSLFPSDFPDQTSDELTLEEAVRNLQVQDRDTARRQAHTRRIGGQQSIATQNRLVKSRPILMPLYRIGPQLKVSPYSGVAAYLGGGRGYRGVFTTIYELLFSNEAIATIGARLTEYRGYAGTTGNGNAGQFCGGFGGADTVDNFSYLQKTCEQIGARLSIPWIAPAGGINNPIKSILAGGVQWPNQPAIRTANRITHGSPISITDLGNRLNTARMASHNGTSNRTMGYVYGGSSILWAGTLLLSIERVNHTQENETFTTIGSVLTVPHHVHAAVGDSIKGYLAFGGNNSTWFTNTVTAFTYSGETVAPLAATLPEPKICVDGVGSGNAGYFVAGDNSSWITTKTIDRLLYDNEAIARLGVQLGSPEADQGGISDYGAGFS